MNKENVTKLIDHLKIMPKKAFSMNEWYAGPMIDKDYQYHVKLKPVQIAETLKQQREGEQHTCGTVACLAGYAMLLSQEGRKTTKKIDTDDVSVIAQKWLGIDDAEAYRLFQPSILDYGAITPKKAIRVLKHFRKTGEVNWSKRHG
jgi:hypothetical protein